MMAPTTPLLFLSCLLPAAVAVHRTSFILSSDSSSCTVLYSGKGSHRFAETEVIKLSRPNVHHAPQDGEEDHDEVEEDQFVELFGPDADAVSAALEGMCASIVQDTTSMGESTAQESELLEYITSGPSTNRIDVVFMGDGYTKDERDDFFTDLARLTNDMFEGPTFYSWLPLFNIWHLFVESNESGIGINSRPKNTRYGLYRVGTELRGVYPSKQTNLRTDCRLAPECDFPSVIGNDPYYGGLGGEFVVSTQSETSGTIVLRHEMGHNFIDVGEGYDGGAVYRGYNFDSSLQNLKWAHWLTNQSTSTPRAEPRRLAKQGYPWIDISGRSYSVNFTSDGNYARWYFRFTASGFPEEGSLQVTLDGIPLEWSPAGIGFDRGFHDYEIEEALTAGTHTLEWKSMIPRPQGAPIRQLCSFELLEYKEDYNYDNEYIGAYPVFDSNDRQRGYGPDHEFCLMRNMSSPYFNKPNIEGMWLQFLARMSLLDGVDVTNDGMASMIKLRCVAVGQLRKGGAIDPEERYEVRWFEDGKNRPDLDDSFEFEVPCATNTVSWSVELQYLTPQVRRDPKNLLFANATFNVLSC